MRLLITGSSGHLGEALMRTLRADGHDVEGLDVLPSPWTTVVGSLTDRDLVRSILAGKDGVLHAATLHKPHVATHTKQDFIDVNVTGTSTLLEEAIQADIGRFVFTSTTSTFGRAMTPAPGAPATWITEDVVPLPRNIYGLTKTTAEGLCELARLEHGLPCIVLRTSRFFPEPDDRSDSRDSYDDRNLKVNELLYRRVDIADAVDAHIRALERTPEIGFGRYIVSATTPFDAADLADLRIDAPAVVSRHFDIYSRAGWSLLPSLDRVYVNTAARRELGWQPRYGFREALDRVATGESPFSPLTATIGTKGYHRTA